jgi:hypothetical protein
MDTLIRIYCGRNIHGINEELTEAAFDAFLTDVVAPLYEGFTILPSTGFYKGKKENTFVIEILTNKGYETDRNIEHISESYTSRYNQECVLVTRQEVLAYLYSGNLAIA